MLIIIIGAGIGGLSAAIDLSQRRHLVILVEDKDGLSEFGAGLQMSSNAIRILHRWGVASAVKKVAFVPGKTLARRYSSGEVLGKVEQNPLYQVAYGFPYVECKGYPAFH
jgi:salicylate hydroxylase